MFEGAGRNQGFSRKLFAIQGVAEGKKEFMTLEEKKPENVPRQTHAQGTKTQAIVKRAKGI